MMEEETPTLSPAPSRIFASMKIVLDFPLVPVIPITTMDSDGNRYHSAAKNASEQWYAEINDSGVIVRIIFLIAICMITGGSLSPAYMHYTIAH